VTDSDGGASLLSQSHALTNGLEHRLLNQIQKYLENAENCVELAEKAKDAPSRARYRRMAEGWLALVHEQEWLAGKVSPLQNPSIALKQKPD
jgi:hypothetical protein